MALQRYLVDFPRLTAAEIDAWRDIPSSVISDSLNRCQSMDARIKPVAPGVRLAGQARTVVPMPGDNSMIHHACSIARPGEVVVVAGGGLDDVALAGEWVARSSMRRGLGGLIIDGSIRDVREIRAMGFPVFAKGAVPRGPHKSFGGRMDVTAAVGGTAVEPGDLVIGDDDGVVVVPLSMVSETLIAAREIMAREEAWLAELDAGRSLVDVLSVLPIDSVVDADEPRRSLRAVA